MISILDSTQTMNIELLGEVSVYFGMGIKIITAFVMGAMIGFDRERKMKSAGIKTNVLICLGACLYTAASLLSFDGSMVGDPNRMAAQVVSGIGFLGAGAIIRGSGGVLGLTTAATIWVVASIGVTVGLGYPFTATIFTVTLFIILKVLDPFYHFLNIKNDYFLEILIDEAQEKRVKRLIFEACEEIIKEHTDYNEKDSDISLRYIVKANPKKFRSLLGSLNDIVHVKSLTYHLNRPLDDKQFKKKKDKIESA